MKLLDWIQHSSLAGVIEGPEKGHLHGVAYSDESQVLRGLVAPGGVEEPWVRNLLALAHGKTLRQVQDHFYAEEHKMARWVGEVGLMRDRFSREVAENLHALIHRGVLSLDPKLGVGGQGAAEQAPPLQQESIHEGATVQ